jgi:hypothetical protein
MDFAVVTAAKRDGELVAGFPAQGPALSEAEMVGVAGLPAADQAGLSRDVTKVVAVADAPRLREGKRGFVNGCARPLLA